MVLLRPPEVQFAEADGNDVWLVTEEGRLQAAVRGIDKLEEELAGGEFLRVHRRFLVNLSRVRVVERGQRGELSLIMEGAERRCGARLAPQRPDRAARARALDADRPLHRARAQRPGARRRARRDHAVVMR